MQYILYFIFSILFFSNCGGSKPEIKADVTAHKSNKVSPNKSNDKNVTKEKKQIIVETDFGHVEIMSDGPNGYNSFKTNQGENALQYALNREEYKSGEYELVIK